MKIIILFLLTLLPLKSFALPQPGNFLVLENATDYGMFAVFNSVLGALNCYESGKYAGIKIDLRSGRYLDPEKGPNWWEYFFEPINLGNQKASKYYYTSEEIRLYLLNKTYPFDKSRANYLIRKYIHIKPHIKDEVDSFVKMHFRNHFVIGVHHRGTDKVVEWPIIPYEKTYNAIMKAINSIPKEKKSFKIFVASDEQNFITFISERFPDHVVYGDFVRSPSAVPLHDYGNNCYKNNYQMGREALLDCLLLSKCDLLIKPVSSCLSLISTRFNPDIPVVDIRK